jgi:hypothetical protein
MRIEHGLAKAGKKKLNFPLGASVSTTNFKAILRLFSGLPAQWAVFDPKLGHVGFVVDRVALVQIFSEYFGLLCRNSFHQLQLLHTHHPLHLGLVK